MSKRIMYVDAHIHLYEYNNADNIVEESKETFFIAVSDDLDSARRTLELWRNYSDRLKPCIGLHPWSIGEKQSPLEEAREIIRLGLREGIECFGEIGLDTQFVAETIHIQEKVFLEFVKAAKDANVTLNLHTPGTWERVFHIISSMGVEKANFHWYTGPKELLKKIEQQGYTISINPAIQVQKKHSEIAREAPLSIILTESDAPYKYKGIELSPLLIPKTIEKIAFIKNTGLKEVIDAIKRNAYRVFKIPV